MPRKMTLDPYVVLHLYKESRNLREVVSKLKVMGYRNYVTGQPLGVTAVWYALVKTREGAELAAARARNKRQSRARQIRTNR